MHHKNYWHGSKNTMLGNAVSMFKMSMFACDTIRTNHIKSFTVNCWAASLLLSISSLSGLSISGRAHADVSHATWDVLLKKHVISLRGGQATQVNYNRFRADQAQALYSLHQHG